eukprot:gene2014-2291_t
MALCGDDGINVRSMRNLKKTSANAKRELTKAVNRISEVLVMGKPLEEIRSAENRLIGTFEDFKAACEEYKDPITDEDDIEECLVYMKEAERRFLDVMERVSAVTHCLTRRPEPPLDDVGPEDWVSEVTSCSSSSLSHSRSSKTSRKSGKLKEEPMTPSLHQHPVQYSNSL